MLSLSVFFSSAPLSVVTDSCPIACLLLILNHRPNHTTELRIPLCHIRVKSVNVSWQTSLHS